MDREADIGNRQGSSQVSIKELRFKNTPINQHHLMLAFILAGNFRCKYFYQCGTVPRIKFLGFEEDACAALALLAYLVGFMEQGAVQYRAWPSREQSWRDGFCMGVRDAFETQSQENPGYELMLAIPAEVMEAITFAYRSVEEKLQALDLDPLFFMKRKEKENEQRTQR